MIEKNYTIFLKAVDEIKALGNDISDLQISDVTELIKSFANTWLSIGSYDTGSMPQTGYTADSVHLHATQLYSDLNVLKEDLLSKNEATDLFAQEKYP
jgi:hypothetical protein